MVAPHNRVNEAYPYLRVKGAPAAIDFYKQVFGATERFRLTEPDGRIGHIELDLGTIVLIVVRGVSGVRALRAVQARRDGHGHTFARRQRR